MMTPKCSCKSPKPVIYGRFNPPAYVCDKCGRPIEEESYAVMCESLGCTNTSRTHKLTSVYALGYIAVVCSECLPKFLKQDPDCIENAKKFRYAEG
jgi:hypothetical protein